MTHPSDTSELTELDRFIIDHSALTAGMDDPLNVRLPVVVGWSEDQVRNRYQELLDLPDAWDYNPAAIAAGLRRRQFIRNMQSLARQRTSA